MLLLWKDMGKIHLFGTRKLFTDSIFKLWPSLAVLYLIFSSVFFNLYKYGVGKIYPEFGSHPLEVGEGVLTKL